MSVKNPLISVVVVNWNGLEDTKVCISSIEKVSYKNKELIVVDNGSSDGSKEYFRHKKNIIFVDLPSNSGFTGGHIAGLEVAQGEYVALLNNDAVVAQDWLTKLLDVFRRHPDAAAVGGKAFLWNENYKEFDNSNPFYSYQEIDSINGYTKSLMTGDDECLVDSISGAALILDRKKLADVGYLDNDFFAYYEETDLLARLKRKGYNVYYTPLAHIWHKIAASSKGGSASPFYLKQMHRNRFYYAYKNFDEQNLRLFLKSYSKEVSKARVKKLISLGKDSEATCRMDAYREIKASINTLKAKRENVAKLGNTYNGTLDQHVPEDITIVIPCYNYQDYVSDAIESALHQTLQPKRIIVINDGSTDESLKVMKKYDKNPVVEIINKKNEGVIATKNLGIELSNTYWTMFLDADDFIEKDTLKTMLECALEQERADVVYSDMKLFGAVSDIFRAKPFQPRSFLKRNYINNTTLINTTLLKRSGGYKQEMKDGLEDWELYVTLLEHNARFRYVPRPLVWYRQHGQDTASRNTKVQNDELGKQLYLRIKSLHPGIFKKFGRRRYFHLLFRSVFIIITRPFVMIVIIRSIPGAFKQSLLHIMHNVRMYLHRR